MDLKVSEVNDVVYTYEVRFEVIFRVQTIIRMH